MSTENRTRRRRMGREPELIQESLKSLTAALDHLEMACQKPGELSPESEKRIAKDLPLMEELVRAVRMQAAWFGLQAEAAQAERLLERLQPFHTLH